MNYIDIVIGLLLLFAAIGGYRKGLISEIMSLTALILGLWGSISFSYILTDFIQKNFDVDFIYLNIVSFIITFILIVLFIRLAGSIINKVMKIIIPIFLNKLAGLAFGILRTALILSIILIALDKIDNHIRILSPQKKSESKLYSPVRKLAPSLFLFIESWDKGNKESQKNNEGIVAGIKESIIL